MGFERNREWQLLGIWGLFWGWWNVDSKNLNQTQFKINCGDGYTTLWIYLMLLNCVYFKWINCMYYVEIRVLKMKRNYKRTRMVFPSSVHPLRSLWHIDYANNHVDLIFGKLAQMDLQYFLLKLYATIQHVENHYFMSREHRKY